MRQQRTNQSAIAPSAMKQQAKSRSFAENSHRTLVSLNKTLEKSQKEIDCLERQQNTAVTNIANYQQAMKMSWRRLEKKRAEYSLRPEQVEKKKEMGRKEMMFQSKTKLYVNKTPDIYNPDKRNPPDSISNMDTGTTASMDDSAIEKGLFLQNSFQKIPPPMCLNDSGHYSSIGCPGALRNIQTPDCDATNILRLDRKESKFPDKESDEKMLSSTSQPLLTQSGYMNKKDSLLRASTMMNLESSTSSLKSFAEFYGQSHSQIQGSRLETLDLAASLNSQVDVEDKKDEEKSESASSTDLSLAEMFDELRQCRYIRHSTTTVDKY